MTMKFNERVPFSAVFSLRRGLNITRANYQENGVPCLSYGDVHSRYLGFVDAAVHPLPKVSTDYLDSAPQCLLKAGEFVFADTSEDYEGAGNCTCVLNESDGLFAGYHTTVASPVRKEICSRYYGYYFLSEDFRNQICKAVSGIKVFSITNSILNATRILFPDFKTQENIANFLEKKLHYIDTLIKLKYEELEKLSEYRQSLITQAVTKGLNSNVEMKDSGLNWLGSIPKDWRISTIGKVMDVTLGKMLENKKADDSYTLERYLCAGSIDWGGVKQDYFKHMWFSPAEKNALLLKPDDCLIVEGGAGFGTVALYKGENYPCYFQNSIIRLREHGKVLSRFAKYWLHITYDSYLDTVCNKATFSHYTKEKVSATPILIPPLNEQEEIVDYLDKRVEAIDAVSKKLENIIDKLTEYRSSLINAAVTGKLNIEEVTHGE